MYYNSIYSQLFNFIPRYRFEKIVQKSGGDRYCKHFTAWKQFLTLLFAQISGKDSLREIENALLANHKRLYHLGMKAVAKSTLSGVMNRRNPEIFKALFEEILDRVMLVKSNIRTLSVRESRKQLLNGVFGNEISPGEYNRLVILLVEKATVWQDRLELELKTSGVKSLMEELKNE